MKKAFSIFAAFLILSVSLQAQDAQSLKRINRANELRKYYFDGKYKEALLIYVNCADELSAEEAYYLGMTSSALYDFETAISYFQQAVDKEKTNTGYEYQLARTLVLMGRNASAGERFAGIIARAPDYLPALFDAAALDYSQKKYKDAIRKFKAVVKLTPSNFLAYYNLAKTYGSLEPVEDYKDSVSLYLSTATSINADYLPAAEMLGTFYFNNKLYDQAYLIFERAALKNPLRSDFYYLAGMCREKEGKYEKAVELYNKAIEIKKDESHYWDHKGFSYYMLEQYMPAINAYKEAVKIDGENASFYVNLAYAYLKTDSMQQAVEALETAAVKMHPEETGKIFCQLGNIYYEKKEYAKAKEQYGKAVVFDPVCIDAYYLGAVCDDNRKNKTLALAGYKKALALIKEGLTEEEAAKDERCNTIKSLISALSKGTKRGKNENGRY